MAMLAQPARECVDIGVDVSKDSLAIDDGDSLVSIANESKAITAWLKSRKGPCAFAIEATNTYHVRFVELAHRRGHAVYVVDGLRLQKYRQSVGVRAKTDPCDAALLRRYLQREKADLRLWEPLPAGVAEIRTLLRRRERLVSARVGLQQSLRGLPAIARTHGTARRHLQRLEGTLVRLIHARLCGLGWLADVRRCQRIEGVGPLTAAALVSVFKRGAFATSDAFIAFIGLDVRPCDSGRFRGKRRLTKQGDPEVRRLLYLAAMAASRSATWVGFYARHRARGLSTTQALVALARKLARVAYALLRDQTDYVPRVVEGTVVAP